MTQTVRRRLGSFLALLAGLLLATAPAARADLDLTGIWDLHMTSPIVHDFPVTIVHAGSSIVVQITTSQLATGTFDPDTRSFSVTTAPFSPACDADFFMSGVASPHGSFISGTGAVESGFEEPCGAVPFVYTATRSACGNGAIDAGETCDDGNRVDGDCCSSECTRDVAGTLCMGDGHDCTADVCDAGGACTHALRSAGTVCRFALDPICDLDELCDGTSLDCPADAIAPPGTVCRPARHPCDAAEVCDPVFAVCPSEPPPADADGDHVADECDVCPTGLPVTEARLHLGNYDFVTDNDKVTLEATIAIAPASVGLLDPIATGIEVAVVSGVWLAPDFTILAKLPGSAYDPVTREGWRRSKSGTTWTWKSKDPTRSITKLRVRLILGTGPVVEVKGSGRRLNFANSGFELPQLTIALDPPAKTMCGEVLFDGIGPPPLLCEPRKGGKRFDCR